MFGSKNMLPSSNPLRFQIKKAILAFLWWPLEIPNLSKILHVVDEQSALLRPGTLEGEPVVATAALLFHSLLKLAAHL